MTQSTGRWDRFAILGSIAACTLATLACQISVGGPEPPGPPIAVSTEAAAGLAQVWQEALLDSAGSGQVVLVLDETQLTSYLAVRLAQSENPILREPQVHLREGVMQIYGRSVQGPFEAGVLVEFEPRLDPQGALGFAITSADFGPLPVPAALIEGLSSMLTEGFAGTLGSLATGIRITTLVISDGELALIGEIR